MDNELASEIETVIPEVAALRHELHEHPEIRLEEHWTSDRVAQFLDGAGVSYTRGHAKGTGIVAVVRGVGERTLALRADMDGLEIQEETGLPYASKLPERMHACGHDGHMACLCGAAKVLARHKDLLKGTVKFIFQPGEEVAAAGRFMVEEGVLDGVDAVFALHAWPGLPVGKIGLRDGPMMASADFFSIEVAGRGCHGAYPSAGVDPVVVAAHITMALQTLVSREVAPWDAAVVTVASIHAGAAANIIPETARLDGTFRALTPEVRETLARGIERIAVNTAQAFRATAKVIIGKESYPPLTNDRAMVQFARESIAESVAPDAAVELEHESMGAEDFAFYLQRVPGAMLCLGISPPSGEASPPLHSPRFDFDDSAIPVAIKTHVGLAARYLDGRQGRD